jgi:hypothetical protein
MLSMVLSGQPYRPLGAPNTARSDINAVTKDINGTQVGFGFLSACLRTDRPDCRHLN